MIRQFRGRAKNTKGTGQVTSYQNGDDGFFQIGFAEAYNVLDTGQYSGTTNIMLNGKTDVHTNKVVQDLVNGKMWSQTVSASVGPTNNGALPWTVNAFGEGIQEYCDAANAARLANHNDWRVPNEKELQSIKNMEAPNAWPNAIAFPVWTFNYMWTSTTRPVSVDQAIRIEFSSGSLSFTLKTVAYQCALVRTS